MDSEKIIIVLFIVISWLLVGVFWLVLNNVMRTRKKKKNNITYVSSVNELIRKIENKGRKRWYEIWKRG